MLRFHVPLIEPDRRFSRIRLKVASDELGVEQAVLAALEHIRDVMKAGWSRAGCKEKPQAPNLIWIDAGYMTDVVYAFCRRTGRPF